MMRYSIDHKTAYNYAVPVHQSYHLLHLAPREVPNQEIIRHRLSVEPAPGIRWDGTDYFGNPYSVLNMEDEHGQLVVKSESVIDVNPSDPVDILQSASWQELANRSFTTEPQTNKDIWPFAAASRHAHPLPELADYAMESFPAKRPVMECVRELTTRIFNDFTFDPSATDVSTPVATVLEQRRGVCQDFAHLQIAALRSLNLPARYVSGYILTHPPEGQVKLQGADASHAWISTWAPECGWIDFDPTNDLIPHGEHITIAYGRDYDDVSPISGVLLGGGAHSVDVAVDVIALNS
jgi:transglutaminase-like putative cysteine protease